MIPKVHAGPEMAMASNESRRMITGNLMKRVLALGDKLRVFLSLAWESVWKMGRDDPRRVIYAFKVGKKGLKFEFKKLEGKKILLAKSNTHFHHSPFLFFFFYTPYTYFIFEED